MCGIAGIIGHVDQGDVQAVNSMCQIQLHRGPDAGAVSLYNGAVLGHRRLSVIDLTDDGLQPMSSENGRYVLVFNGEIYNYKELRKELSPSYEFKSLCDTEVLLAAWQVWGEKCLQRLNGMFAFCIFDTVEKTAFLARDRFGQKPVVLAEKDGRLYFSSEVKGLLAAGIKAEADLSTWARYLTTASYDDTKDTFFKNVTQLLPGECARFDVNSRLQRYRYYALSDMVKPVDVDLQEAADEVRELLVDAHRIHMRSDVPVAMMLSGGLDSSSMLACLDIAGRLGSDVQCLSVEFGQKLSERPWIEAAAAHHSLPSRIDDFSPQGFQESIKPMQWHLEGPIGGLMTCGLRLVMQAARDGGFIVLQDGSGADEIYGGYRNHHHLQIAEINGNDTSKYAKAITEYAQNWGVDEKTAQNAIEQELERTNTAIDGTIPVRPELFTEFLKSHQISMPELVKTTGSRFRDALVEYTQGSKIPRNMRMMDRLSMGYGLELRLPFLDPRLVEHALSLPADYYFLEGRSKGIMREALAGAMDDEVRLATKRSIQAPQGIWLREPPMRQYVEELISSESFASRGLFDVEKSKAAFEDFCLGHRDNSFFIWQWINTEEWFRIFVDNNAVTKPHNLCPALAADIKIDTSHDQRPLFAN
jgi:asparagine synthase (glutamine-hydrolysing)